MKKRSIKREAKVAELHVERMKLSQLKPHPKNPRKHPKAGTPAWDVLLASLEHDYFDPMVWNKRNGMLVSGHLRKKVLVSMGVSEADVVVVDYDENLHVARMIAANKPIGEDDKFKLSELFGGLAKVEGFNLSLTGFSLPEVESLNPQEDADTVDSEDSDGESAHGKPPTFTTAELARLFGKSIMGEPEIKVEPNQIYRVNANYLVCANIIRQHDLYVPLLAKLAKEFPKRKILFIPAPDPIMVGCVDTSVACVMVQPSAMVASWALTLLKRRSPKTKITQYTP